MPTGTKIKDKFTNLPVSRQRKWQLRKDKQGRCERCGKKRNKYKRYCDECYNKRSEINK